MSKSGTQSIVVPVIMVAVIAAAATASYFLGRPDPVEAVEVTVPETLSAEAQQGKVAFEQACASCHGDVAQGTTQGPPLVHIFYEPGHHSDGAFLMAIRRGTPQHHWEFGDMPPQPGVSDNEAAAIIAYIRELQQANGIN